MDPVTSGSINVMGITFRSFGGATARGFLVYAIPGEHLMVRTII